MKIRHISASELDADLMRQWAALQSVDSRFESPFFRPEFTHCVARVRSNVELGIVEHGGRALAFFPFERVSPGVGGPVGAFLSDYHGIVSSATLDPGFDARELLRTCRLNSWDFDHLPAAQTLIGTAGLSRLQSPQIDLSAGFEGYARSKRAAGSQLIERAAYLERRLAREVGPVHFVGRECETSAFGKLLRWKSAQYLRTGLPDIFRACGTRELMDLLREARAPEFEGVLSALYAGGRLIAAHFGLRSRGLLHYWFPAYDVDFSRYSPGLILLLNMAGDCEALGIDAIDLGAGDQPYKARLANRANALCAGSFAQSNWSSFQRNFRRKLISYARKAPFAETGRSMVRKLRARKFRTTC